MRKQIFEDKSDGTNLDLLAGYTLKKCLEMSEGFQSILPPIQVKKVGPYFVVDEGANGFVGTKTRFAEWFVANSKAKELVYCQPATGLAGPSLCWLAKKFKKKLTLFMPARAEATKHQLYCIEQGAKPIFRRIAAMPNLQGMAKKYAEETKGAEYIPFGLKHPLVTVGGVRAVYDQLGKKKPNEIWTVISTGVLTRVLQIVFPKAKFTAVAVARNIHSGEMGHAKFMSYHKPFTESADFIPKEFQTVDTYDAKGYEYMLEGGASKGAWFWNVAKDVGPQKLTSKDIDSYRDWGQE